MPATRSFISFPATTDVIEKHLLFLNYYISRDYTSTYAQHLFKKKKKGRKLVKSFHPGSFISFLCADFIGEKSSPFKKKKKKGE